MSEPEGERGANFRYAIERDGEHPARRDNVRETGSVGVLIAPIYPTVATVALVVGSVAGVGGVNQRVPTSMELITGGAIIDHSSGCLLLFAL